ncbi:MULTISPECIES: DUF3862 domain-containing protein [Salinivibrio]|jgi:hypothetical protein|uniref:DUF3862 domain-containing protein n=1 Tax=Salinivibrio kushneri TaxID=1908198 RepID=A0AB36JXZ5_9GAMM|nr:MULTISPECIES: DUF3862 domain-containing protein [Salinivibrio]OOE35199.1 DUF3862 domain-containing protein [Salinivibrio kushneri]OOE39997.1 DUF3862 domain-containing protein [Salinivibrio kushneri]OOE45931.1 DUF3862 domain-containing protein [Salinivibrio kushneri]OOE46482.1 DUF3862 domain-containing protein [Salinivibrio kushneri]OOE51114.1 DUF3862 domain-containing protein [Salinivibrio kushneri]
MRVFFACVLVVLLAGCSKVTKQNYDQLEVGMSYDVVVSHIGEPSQCDDTMGLTHCVWGGDGQHIKVSFVADKATVLSAKGLK